MPKFSMILFLLAFAAGAAFARPALSAGGGVAFDFDIGGVNAGATEPSVESYTVSSRFHTTGFGAWGFLDARFVELSIGFFGGLSSEVLKNEINIYGVGTFGETERGCGTFMLMNFNLLGKFPFSLGGGGNISVFPLLGIGYNIALFHSSSVLMYGLFDSLSEMNAFRIKFGVGSDFDLRGNNFIRVQILGFYRFPTRNERDIANLFETMGFNADSNGGLGVSVRVGLGVRL